MSVSKANLCVLACLLAAGQAFGASSIQGLFRGQHLGAVEFNTEDGYVSGKYAGGGQCAFEERRRVIEGQFEGNVLVGRMLLCQTGPACTARFVDFVAFYNPTEGTLTGEVKGDTACASPALELNKYLKLKLEEGRKAPPVKPAVLKKNVALGAAALTQAHGLMLQDKYEDAKELYLVGLSYIEHNWQGYLGLGVAEMKMGHELAAVEAFDRARDLNPKYGDTYFNLACAWARLGNKSRALLNVKHAVDAGGMDKQILEEEPDLATIRDGPEWERIVEQLSSGVTANRKDDH
ncbi:MAG: TPR end-of-group domain-containing protein [Myxococcaceae bacterium]